MKKKNILFLLIILLTVSCLSQAEKPEEYDEVKEAEIQNTEIQDEEDLKVENNVPQIDEALEIENSENLPDRESGDVLSAVNPSEESEPDLNQEQSPPILSYQASTAPDYIYDITEDLPLPEYIISFYSFVSMGEESLPPSVDVALPTYRKKSAPVKTNSTPVVKPAVEEAAVPEKEILSAVITEEIREERYILGIAIPLVLDGTDWLYMGEESSLNPGYQDRKVLLDRTLFTFAFPKEGSYVLLFQRQDHSTGNAFQEKIRVIIEKEPTVKTESDSSISSENSAAEGDLSTDQVIDPEIPVLVKEDAQQAEARLDEIEENPEEAEEALELLEFLVNVKSDNDTLAGYYYRMARLLEMNSLVYDLRRAYETYQYIVENFFLTDYYELSEERIRFLDRHFFKLR